MMPPDPPQPGNLENLAKAAYGFPASDEEREAYLEALRRAGASEAYIRAIEKAWDARDSVKGIPGDLWDRFVDWVKDLFGKNNGRSG